MKGMSISMLRTHFEGRDLLIQMPTGGRVNALMVYRISDSKKQLWNSFLTDFLGMFNIVGKNAITIFLFFVNNVDYKTLRIKATNKKFDNLMHKAGYHISDSTINNVLSKMSQGNLMKRKHGYMILNSDLADQCFTHKMHSITLENDNMDNKTINTTGVSFNYRLNKRLK